MILEVGGVSFAYRSSKILEGVSLGVAPGEIVSVMGPNGVGKSTLIKCIDAILRGYEGTLLVDGEDVRLMSSRDRASRIAYVTQESTGSRMKVFESVLLGRKPYITMDAAAKDLVITERIIDLMGIEDIAMEYMDEISGGQRQLVHIARSLAQEPSLLLLDEPTNNLDLKNQYESLDVIRRIAKANGIAVVMVIHDINLALRFSDTFVMMKGGRIAYAGGPEVVNSDSIKDIYGMDALVEEVHGYRTVVPIIGGLGNE